MSVQHRPVVPELIDQQSIGIAYEGDILPMPIKEVLDIRKERGDIRRAELLRDRPLSLLSVIQSDRREQAELPRVIKHLQRVGNILPVVPLTEAEGATEGGTIDLVPYGRSDRVFHPTDEVLTDLLLPRENSVCSRLKLLVIPA